MALQSLAQTGRVAVRRPSSHLPVDPSRLHAPQLLPRCTLVRQALHQNAVDRAWADVVLDRSEVTGLTKYVSVRIEPDSSHSPLRVTLRIPLAR